MQVVAVRVTALTTLLDGDEPTPDDDDRGRPA